MANKTVTSALGGEPGQEAIDAAFIIICTYIIFTMQSGFGLLESGLIRRKCEANVMVKNMLDIVIGGFGFWCIGNSIAHGEDPSNVARHFTGKGDYFVDADIDETSKLAKYLFHLAFSSTSTTIVSGAVAERIRLNSYMFLSFVQATFTYSFPAHWLWDEEGWLKVRGAYDFAGASAVHITGGAASLIAAAFLGPRQGRFSVHEKEPFAMSNPTNVILGTFFLWFGWLGFNCGSTFAVTGGMWKASMRAGVVTMNGAIGGGIAGILISLCLYRKRRYILDIQQFTTAILGGLVAITGGAAVLKTWHGIVVGFIGGLLSNAGVVLIEKLHIDDPVGCFPVHWICGIWSMIATGLFAQNYKGLELVSEPGLFYGGSGNLLLYNIAAGFATTGWAVMVTVALFLAMKFTIGIRVSTDQEERGSDQVEHNIIEYAKENKMTNVLKTTVTKLKAATTPRVGQNLKSKENAIDLD